MKAENVILGLLGITIVGGIGFSIYKKAKATKDLADKKDDKAGTSTGADGSVSGGWPVFGPLKKGKYDLSAAGPNTRLRTASSVFTSFMPAAKKTRVKDGVTENYYPGLGWRTSDKN